MHWRTIVLGLVLLAFGVFTAGVIAEHGVVGFLDLALANAVTLQVSLDLVIALALFAIWMIGDARERGLSPWPFFVAMLGVGSIAALAYLLWRERASQGVRLRAPA